MVIVAMWGWLTGPAFAQQISVTKSSSASTGGVPPGGAVTYWVTVTNNSAVPANGTLVSDPLPVGIVSATWTCQPAGGARCTVSGQGAIADTISSFPAFGSVEYTVTAQVSSNPPRQIANTATATPPSGTCFPANTPPPCRDTVVNVAGAQIQISKTSSLSSGTLPAGGSLTYTVVVKNAGSVDASGTMVSDPLPAGIANATWICAGTAGAVCAASGSNAVADTLTAFPPGAIATYTIAAQISAAPPPIVTNTASATPPNGLCLPGNTVPPCTASVSNPPQAQIRVSKVSSAGASALPPNGVVTYVMTVANVGNVDAGGTRVSDPLPTGLPSATWTCTGTNGAVCAAHGTGAISDVLSTFAAGGVATYTLTAQVAASVPPSVTNTVSVQPPAGSACLPTNTPPPCTASATNPPVPQVQLTKVSSAGTQRVIPSGTVTYTVTASNLGTLDAAGSTLSDPLAPGIAGASWTCQGTGGAACALSGTGPITDTLTSFPPGGVATYVVTAQVAALPPALVVNVAQLATAGAGLCLPSSTAAPCVVSAENMPVPQIAVKQTSSGESATGALTYAVTVTNGGNVDASGTTVSDTVPTGLQNPTWTCVAVNGAACTAKGTGSIADTLSAFPPGASATYTITGTAYSFSGATFVNAASATPALGGVCLPANTPGPCVASVQDSVAAQPAPGLTGHMQVLLGLGVILVAFGVRTRNRLRRNSIEQGGSDV